MTSTSVAAFVPAKALDPAGVYLSPLNRRCRVLATETDADGRELAHMAYDTPGGRAARGHMVDSFALAAGNWRYLRRVS